MRRILIFVLVGLSLLSACGAVGEEGTGVEAHDAWVRTALKGDNSAAYLLLHNHSANEDALLGASSDIATAVEIHLSQAKADGTMKMDKQESVALPADSEVEFTPGSYHIMLIGLKRDLKKGDEITLILHFKNHEDISLTVPALDTPNMDSHMP
jgi:periplasmic copper chaperone A